MPRIFDRSQADASVAPPRTASRSAARALASAFAALLVSLLVVSRSVAALGGGAGSFNNVFGVAAIESADPQTQASPVGAAGGAASPEPGEPDAGAGGTEGATPGATEGSGGSGEPGGEPGGRPRATPAPGTGGTVPGATPGPTTDATAPPPPTQVVELTDDDAGATLFSLPAMTPGEAYSRCITVTYRGVVPARVALHAGAEGELASALGALVEVGAQGGFDDCTGFTPERVLYDGSLAELASAYGLGTAGLGAFSPAASPESRTFRFTFRIDDVAPQGATARADLSWTTSAS